jgi:hypothetical protein
VSKRVSNGLFDFVEFTQSSLRCCSYNVYLAIFGTIVTLLTMLNLTEQKYIQLFMTLYR